MTKLLGQVRKFWGVIKVDVGHRGFSLIELVMVLAVIAILSGVAITIFNNRVAPANWAQVNNDRFNSVMQQLNICKADHGNTYPAAPGAASITAAGTTSVPSAVSAYVGSASTDINNWTYQCVAAGQNLLIAVIDGGTPSSDAQNILVTKINNTYGAGTAVITSATTVTAKITGTTCQ